jgi:type IV secretory pathway component VirB8
VADVVKPPVLVSRTLTFVLAASIAVLATLVFSLYNMVPLTKPEVFFLINQSRANYVLKQPNPKDSKDPNKEKRIQEEYIKGFIRTYVIARNSIEDSRFATIERWNSIVKPWSSKPVYDAFINTDAYKDVMENYKNNIVCSVDFSNGNVVFQSRRFRVTFDRTCFDKNSGRQIGPKSYKIDIEIQSYLDNKSDKMLSYLEDLRTNPLGIQITEYKVLTATGTDPLSDIETDFYKEGM